MGAKPLNREKTLQRSVGNVQGIETLDLLPSSLKLIDMQDRLTTDAPTKILSRGIGELLGEYDYVLIDCPPNLGRITRNGLDIADAYLIPTIPDVLSTYGIPQIVTKVKEFEEMSTGIVPLGIVATKVRRQVGLHKRTLEIMREKAGKPMGESQIAYPYVFRNIFIETAQIAEAAEFQRDATLHQKWKSSAHDAFYRFAYEFIERCKEV
ncbi:MAG: AAA family ATPase [Christensenellaceae bacterium]|jgi:chromosome partitioning protein|nr:AAA family ATPase [Christensenellaceae bacterium]